MNIGFYFSPSRAGLSLYNLGTTMMHALQHADHQNRYRLFYRHADYPRSVEGSASWTPTSAEDRTVYAGFGGWLAHQRERVLRRLIRRGLLDPDQVCVRPGLRRLFEHFEIDLMFYPTMDLTSFEVGLPYVFTISDLWFKIQPEFMDAAGMLPGLEYSAQYGCRHAEAVITDSEVGKEDIVRFYSVLPERVVVAPFVPPTLMARHEVGQDDLHRVREKYRLPDGYVFYPASMRPEKNHERLVRALHWIRETYGLSIPCILAGPVDAYRDPLVVIQTLGMHDQVRHVGIVADEDMAPLYRLALMMVMPTFIGPTNLPVVEAWSLGCPVVSSDIHGIREQVGDAGLVADPTSVEAIGMAIYRLYSDAELRQTVIARGAERVRRHTFQDYANILACAVQTVGDRLKAS